MRACFWLVIGGLVLSGCEGGGEAGASAPTNGRPCVEKPKTGASNCIPDLSLCWAPAYKPPKADRTACTEAQVLDEKSKCYGADRDPSCAAFARDPANAACLACLFSTVDEPAYGAIV